MLKEIISKNILIKDKLSFVEIELINQPNGSNSQLNCLNTNINKKKYFDYQNNIKKLTKSKGKKTHSRVRIFNNYKEVNIGTKYYYYDVSVLSNNILKQNNINFLLKQTDNKILDPIEFPDLNKYHNNYVEQSYRYRYMPDNRVINSIDIYFSSIKEKDNAYFNIYFKFKVCDKNHKVIIKNLLTILNKLNFKPHYKRN